MRFVHGRPLGVWAITGMLSVDGLSFIVAGFELAAEAPGEWVAVTISWVIGALMLWKAYNLWSLHPTAWLLVLVATAVGGAIHSLEVVRGHAEPATWMAIAWALVTIIYLGHPNVRALFVHPCTLSDEAG
jgi:hypothetical protein